MCIKYKTTSHIEQRLSNPTLIEVSARKASYDDFISFLALWPSFLPPDSIWFRHADARRLVAFRSQCKASPMYSGRSRRMHGHNQRLQDRHHGGKSSPQGESCQAQGAAREIRDDAQPLENVHLWTACDTARWTTDSSGCPSRFLRNGILVWSKANTHGFRFYFSESYKQWYR